MDEKQYNGLSFVFDIDGTLCPVKKKTESYADLKPFPEILNKLREYHSGGAKIILHTSRNMNSYKGNVGVINKCTAPVLLEWLSKWNVPYDEIYYGKPWPGRKGFYVDDRSVRPKEFLSNSPEHLNAICESGRCQSANLDIVITMGGVGKRFREAGYECPKYMIKARGKTLFDWSIMSLEGYRHVTAQYIFVAMKDDRYDVEEFIHEHCLLLNITNYHIVLLDYLTDGQATTAMLASKYWMPEHSLLIYNIDTYVEPGQMRWQELKGDGFIPCFYGEGNHWSFVQLDDSGKAIAIREKERISPNCTLGAYYFHSCELFSQLYIEYYSNPTNLINGEKYVAPLYQHLVDNGKNVYISVVDSSFVHVLGTPSELREFTC